MEPRIIICEGADASGKSTLAKAIAEKWGGVYWHMTWNKKLGLAFEDYMMEAYRNAIENMRLGKIVVFDRFWISDLVYGTHFRGGPDFDHTELKMELLTLKTLYIGCRALDPVKSHRDNLDGEHPYTDEDIVKLCDHYDDVFETLDQHPETLYIPYLLQDRKPQQAMEAFIEGIPNFIYQQK